MPNGNEEKNVEHPDLALVKQNMKKNRGPLRKQMMDYEKNLHKKNLFFHFLWLFPHSRIIKLILCEKKADGGYGRPDKNSTPDHVEFARVARW